MCFGSKAGNTDPPPPSKPTTFDYSIAQRGDQAVRKPTVTQPTASFGSELGASTPATQQGGR